MADQSRKRKLGESTCHPTFGMPNRKRREVAAESSRNTIPRPARTFQSPRSIIEIKDDSDDDSADTKPSIQPAHKESHEQLKHLLAIVDSHGEELKQIHQVEETLRDQITDCSLSTQRLEAVIAELNIRVQATPLLDTVKETVLQLLSDHDTKNEQILSDIKERLKKIENNTNNTNQGNAPAFVSFNRRPSTQNAYPSVLSTSTSPFTPTHNKPTTTLKSLSESESESESESAPTLSLTFPVPHLPPSLGLSQADWAPPELSNAGLAKLLRQADFSDVSHLRALAQLDSRDRDRTRDAVLFCDWHPLPLLDVDYMIFGGRAAFYIADHPSCERRRESPGLGLDPLRVLELGIEPAGGGSGGSSREEAAMIQAWRERQEFPVYVYDLGQLFLRRWGPGPWDVHATQYNVVVDMTAREKAVWLVMRPEFTVPMVRKEKDSSTIPFEILDGIPVARMAACLADLKLTRPCFSLDSSGAYRIARREVEDSACKAKACLQFRVPDLEIMMETLADRWSGTDNGTTEE
ncbi:hypothetical protein F4809DRAFT_588335 [Biscogniauxia mediterranea]|nr:hypothetical protein F4809DRAFT_588335 [Biscogniauxia mediterranea]